MQATPLRQDRVLSYWIVDGNYNNLFELDPNTGKLIMRFGVDINDTPDRQALYVLLFCVKLRLEETLITIYYL